MKPADVKRNKVVVAELVESFYANDKEYRGYSFGFIKNDKGTYSFKPTPADDAYTEDEKLETLKNTLEAVVFVFDAKTNKDVKKTKADFDFIESFANNMTNMYGGLYLRDEKAFDGEPESDDEEEEPELPDETEPVGDEDEPEEIPEEDAVVKPIATKKKKMIN